MPEDKKPNSNTTSSSPLPINPASASAKADKPTYAPLRGASVDKPADKPTDKPESAPMPKEPTTKKSEVVPTPAPQDLSELITPEIEPGESIPKEPVKAETEPAEVEDEVLPEIEEKIVEEEIKEEVKEKEKNAIDELVEQAKEEVKTFDQQVAETKEEPKVKKEIKPKIPVTAVKPSSTYAPFREATVDKSAPVGVPAYVETPADKSAGKEEEKIRVVAPPEAAPIVPFALKFLKHLGILRGQANKKRQENIQARLDKIMAYAREHQKITNDDVEHLTGVSDRQALRDLNSLVKEKKLVRFGKKKNVFYKPLG